MSFWIYQDYKALLDDACVHDTNNVSMVETSQVSNCWDGNLFSQVPVVVDQLACKLDFTAFYAPNNGTRTVA